MTNAIALLREKAFWFFYVHANEDPLPSEVLRHFGTTNINGRVYPEAVVSLSCGDRLSLQITITPDLASIDLALRDAGTDAVAEMGWWDDARWHPHALRWSELLRLHEYWTERLDAAVHPSAAFLLLAVFVGHGSDERDRSAERKALIASHYERLKLFNAAEVAQLTDDTFILPSEDDYRWTRDEELGWVFGGDYPCYSIRNREHSGGSEGMFPFSEWATAMAQLPPPAAT